MLFKEYGHWAIAGNEIQMCIYLPSKNLSDKQKLSHTHKHTRKDQMNEGEIL